MYCDLQGPSRSHRTHVLQRCHGSKEVDALVEGTICRNILVEKNRFPAMFPENQSKYISWCTILANVIFPHESPGKKTRPPCEAWIAQISAITSSPSWIPGRSHADSASGNLRIACSMCFFFSFNTWFYMTGLCFTVNFEHIFYTICYRWATYHNGACSIT